MRRRLRIEFHPNNAWATIRTTKGDYVCTVNSVGPSPRTRKDIARWRRRAPAVKDALEIGIAAQAESV